MLQVAKKFGTNLAAIRLSPHLSAQLPIWYHLNAVNPPINTAVARCLLTKHSATTVDDLLKQSTRIRSPDPQDPHRESQYCRCRACNQDRELHCINPHACALEAWTRIQGIAPKFNPTIPIPPHGSLSLTRRRKALNVHAQAGNGEILFDPTITCKENLAECFRIFTKANAISDNLARRHNPQGPDSRHKKITVYTDGACFDNGKANARSGCGIWFGENDQRNTALRIPGPEQSNQVGEIAAVIIAASKTPTFQPLEIVSDSKYVINGLTTHLENWENKGWIEIKNANFFKKATYLLRKRSATTTLRWVKGHNGITGNEESDQLAQVGAKKEREDELDLEIPMEFNIQGAKIT
jgi:ribonuclease HI